MSNENALLSYEFEDNALDINDFELRLEEELELQLANLAFLENEREKIDSPENLGEVITNEVLTQFGNQIGLDISNETLIQTYNREHPEEYNKAIADAIISDEKYQQAKKVMKEKHASGELTDEYTGKKIGVQDKPNLDHVVPRKELYDDPRRKQSGIDTADLANKYENLKPTNESLNKSKKDKSNREYINQRETRELDLKKQNEADHKKIDASNKSDLEKRLEHEKIDKRLQDKLDADDERMLNADKEARKAIKRDITKGVAKQTIKKAGMDALKMMVMTALVDLLKSIMNGLIRFFKEKHKTFQLFLSEMKEAIRQFASHISSFAQTATSSFIGTVVSEIFGPIVSMFKKLASFIKQGASTLVEAVHYLTDEKNKNEPLNIKIAQVGKIVTAGLASAGAIIGGELIEKALLQIPVMAVEIPLMGSIANITGMFLSSLLSGVIGAIIINRIDHHIADIQKSSNLSNQIAMKNEILTTQDKLIDIKLQQMSNIKETASQRMAEHRMNAAELIDESLSTIFYEDEDNDDTAQTLASIKNDLNGLLD